METDPAIAPLRGEQVPEAGHVLATSLADDPAHRHVFPDPDRRVRALRAGFTKLVLPDAVPFGATHAASVDGRILGVAVWLPPGCFPLTLSRKLRGTRALFSVLWIAPGSFVTFMRLGANVEGAYPREPHWYLEVLGVHPDAQGRGLGTRLLEPALVRADSERRPCYLETSSGRNVRFYERLGFQVEREAAQLVPGGPTHWTMRRPPASH